MTGDVEGNMFVTGNKQRGGDSSCVLFFLSLSLSKAKLAPQIHSGPEGIRFTVAISLCNTGITDFTIIDRFEKMNKSQILFIFFCFRI